MLRSLIECYLRGVGFTTYERDGVTYWGHPNLGHGRTFEQAVTWWTGCETLAATHGPTMDRLEALVSVAEVEAGS